MLRLLRAKRANVTGLVIALGLISLYIIPVSSRLSDSKNSDKEQRLTRGEEILVSDIILDLLEKKFHEERPKELF